MRGTGQKWIWVVVGSMLVACGGKSGEGPDNGSADTSGEASSPSGVGNKEGSCSEACSVAESCGLTVDDCIEDCTDNVSVSNFAQEAISECVSDLGCEPSELEFVQALLCLTEEVEDAQLSDEQEAFCEETAPALQQCTGYQPDETLGDCQSQAVVLSDELLEDINACAEREGCEALQTCLALQIFQGVDISVLGELGNTGELNAGALADLVALLAIGSQLGDLGQDTGVDDFLGLGGGSP